MEPRASSAAQIRGEILREEDLYPFTLSVRRNPTGEDGCIEGLHAQ